jgi:hypothetical protein
VIDAAATIDRQGIVLRGVKGRGSIEDLNDLGFAVGWHGNAQVDFSELRSDFARTLDAVGDIRVSNLTSARIAAGADLGSYELRLPEGAVGADGNVSAQLVDTGGPLEVQAVLHYSAKERTGLLTGTIRERPDAPPALHSQLESLSQLRPRDPQGRMAVDLEFAL